MIIFSWAVLTLILLFSWLLSIITRKTNPNSAYRFLKLGQTVSFSVKYSFNELSFLSSGWRTMRTGLCPVRTLTSQTRRDSFWQYHEIYTQCGMHFTKREKYFWCINEFVTFPLYWLANTKLIFKCLQTVKLFSCSRSLLYSPKTLFMISNQKTNFGGRVLNDKRLSFVLFLSGKWSMQSRN